MAVDSASRTADRWRHQSRGFRAVNARLANVMTAYHSHGPATVISRRP
jgi:hypothetical protein